MQQINRDLATLESFTYNTPVQEVFERIKKALSGSGQNSAEKPQPCGETNKQSMPLPEDAVVDRCKRFDKCPASGKGHAGCYSSVGCFL